MVLILWAGRRLSAKAREEGRFLDAAVALVGSVDHKRGLARLQALAVLAVSGSSGRREAP